MPAKKAASKRANSESESDSNVSATQKRKAASQTNKPNKRARHQEADEEELAQCKIALNKMTEAYDRLYALSKEEEGELQKLKHLSEARNDQAKATLQEYKKEVARLTEILALPADQRDTQIQLEAKSEECKLLKEQLVNVRKQSTESEKARAREAERELQAARDQVKQLEKELEQETAHSKQLQAKLKSSPSRTTDTHTASTAPDANAQDILNLSADLTGLLVSSVATNVDKSRTYNCVLSDTKNAQRCLSFKLIRKSSVYQYVPQYDEQRDAHLKLSEEFMSHMQFDLKQISNFFRNLWKEINGICEAEEVEYEDGDASFISTR